jgi:hypothetical protein
MSTDFIGICIYGLVVIALTVIVLLTKGWSRQTLIILLIAWVPWILFSVAVLLLMVSVEGILRVFVGTLIIGAPLVLMIIIPIVLFKFLDRWRN